MEVFKLLHEVNVVSVTVRIFLAVLLGGALGAERGLRHRPAGFMTYLIVCMGATIIMLTDQYLCTIFPNAQPNRLAAQVVSGIGFLGAGTIIVTKTDEIRGLTTAAGLWLAAGLGIAIGAGFYTGAIIGFAVTMFAMVNLKKVDVYIKQHAKRMEIYMEYNEEFSLRRLSAFADENNFELSDIQRGRVKTLKKEMGTMSFFVEFPQKRNHADLIALLYALEGIEYIREVL